MCLYISALVLWDQNKVEAEVFDPYATADSFMEKLPGPTSQDYAAGVSSGCGP